MANKQRRKVCVVTTTRAEYGLLHPLIREIVSDPKLELQLVVSGAHLSADFGMTISEIEDDGFKIAMKVPILSGIDTAKGVLKTMSNAIDRFGEAFDKLKPHLVVVLGDRYEIFSAVATATVMQIPVGHISGGEVTVGAIDDAFRHSITKMSHLHFTSTDEYRKRVIQLGEDPSRVYSVGALSMDNIRNRKLMSRTELERTLGIRLKKRNILVTYHPETISSLKATDTFKELVAALKRLKDAMIIFTYPNADHQGEALIKMIRSCVRSDPSKFAAFESLGQLRYLSLLNYSDVMAGNSSSGITEAPAMGVPTVNIGDRQTGRIRAASVIDCFPVEKDIYKALTKALDLSFKRAEIKKVNPYGDGKTGKKICRVLASVDLEGILKKKFYDL